MKIRYLKHKDIDKAKWDNCIARSANGIVYAYSWYLDIVAKRWDALIKGDYESVMPLTCKKKMGINYIYQPAFVQQLGVFSINPVNDNMLTEFIEAIPNKFKYIEYNLNIYNKLPAGNNYKTKINQTFELDLINKYEDIKNNYSTNNKRNIKKAKKNNLFITYSSKPEPIISLFRNNRGKRTDTIKSRDYNNLKHLTYFCLNKGIADIHSAFTDKNVLIAGIILVRSHKRIIFLFSGSNQTAHETGAMSFIIDDFIFRNSEKPYILDFEGSNHPGTARFYKSFGSKKHIYQTLIINRMPLTLKLFFYLYKKVKSLFLRSVK